jgi:hypothetical protein
MEAALSSETLLPSYPTVLDHHISIRQRQITMLFAVSFSSLLFPLDSLTSSSQASKCKTTGKIIDFMSETLHFYVGDRKKKHSGDKLSKRFQNIYSSS